MSVSASVKLNSAIPSFGVWSHSINGVGAPAIGLIINSTRISSVTMQPS